MFRKFSEWAVAYAIRLGYIPKEEEQEEYTYGLDLIMSVIVSDLTMLVIGIIMKMIPQVIVFGFMYKFIRKYAGGFHCETVLDVSICRQARCVYAFCLRLNIFRIILAYTQSQPFYLLGYSLQFRQSRL